MAVLEHLVGPFLGVGARLEVDGVLDSGDNALVVQPGPAPTLVDTVARATGPTS